MLKINRPDLSAIAAYSAGDLFFQHEGKETKVLENGSSNWQLKRKQ
jgi:hypothetical protein